MKHCDVCLTNVEDLCPHCRTCACCCEENNCFDCKEIGEIREMIKTKADAKAFIQAIINTQNSSDCL